MVNYPITESQLEVWLASNISTEANCAYNECASIRFAGALDEAALKHALQAVVDRNESLRSTFSEDGAIVVVHENVELDYNSVDLRELAANEQTKRVDDVIRSEGTTPFDLVNGPLLRVRLVKLANETRLIFTAHHIILDGWSLWVFCRDLGHFYTSIVNGNECDLPEAQPYRLFAEACENYKKSNNFEEDREFWVSQFQDSLPTLDLPTDRPRPGLKTFPSERHDCQLSAELVKSLRKVGAKNGSSLFHVMLCGFNAFLTRITGQADICIGIPTAGQNATGLEEVLGHCVNSLPIRSNNDTSRSFAESLPVTRSLVLDALDHEKYTFGTLLRDLAPPRDPSRSPVFQIMFNVDPEINPDDLGFAGLEVQVCVEPRMRENLDWFINGVIKQDGSLELQCQYNTDLFDAETMEGLFESYIALLEDAAQNPDTSVAELKLLSHAQAERTIVAWNATDRSYPTSTTVAQEFARQAEASPDDIAIEFNGNAYTYAEVQRQVQQLATLLRQRGVKEGQLVGVSLDRTEQLPIALLAVMSCGAGYVPLDPAYPVDRLTYMVEDSGLELIITQASQLSVASQLGASLLDLDETDSFGVVDDSTFELSGTPDDIAYVIYTSGSTGKPKGVQVPHRAVVNFLYSMKDSPGFTADDRLLAVTTPSFDISVLEMFLPLICGAQLFVCDQATASDGKALAEKLESADITVFQATPATWRLMLDAGWNSQSGLKAMCGGEPMPSDLIDPLLANVGELWNMYGPTETTVWSSIFRIEDSNTILVGKPIGNTQIYMLDAHLQPVPVGVAGEVFIGGGGVTLGYRNREEMTNERFVENPYFNPFADYTSNKLYRTGDLAKFRHDGNIEFLRRNDKQVKVRGFRIELGEIEHQLQCHNAIRRAIVVVNGGSGTSEANLVAYYLCEPGNVPTVSDLRAHLRDSLPHYMIPQHFVELDDFPKTNNGKIDYNSLPDPSDFQGSEADFVPPETEAEVLLADVWCEALDVDTVGINDNFFSLGGHSLLVMKVIAEIEERTAIRLSPQDFLMGTLEQIADKLPVDFAAEAGTPIQPSNPIVAPSLEEPSKPGLFGAIKSLWS